MNVVKIAAMVVFILGSSLTSMAAPRKASGCSAWNDTFTSGSLDSRWVVVSGSAPGTSSTYNNTSSYDPNNVLVTPGLLRITLTQVPNGSGILSYGGAIRTNQTCGYGTYQWTMRMSSTALCKDATCQGEAVSGSVSAGFIYVNNSQTEIDFEMQGQDSTAVHLVNWKTTSNETSTLYPLPGSPAFNPIDGLHVYKFVWTKGKISYYVDGNFAGTHTTNVPTAPAYFWINHWGTNSPYWGGTATTGVARYLYVTQASYSPSVN